MKTDDALRFAQERDLDLVEVAPEARPPVCRILDYSKYKYEQAQKQKAARKHQQQITIREIKFRPKIAQHDYDTKKGHVERFLSHKDKVKITIMFRGREVTHPERGAMILDRLAEDLAELAVIEQRPEPRRPQHDDAARAVQGGLAGDRRRWTEPRLRRRRRPSRPRRRTGRGAPRRRARAAPAEAAAPGPRRPRPTPDEPRRRRRRAGARGSEPEPRAEGRGAAGKPAGAGRRRA